MQDQRLKTLRDHGVVVVDERQTYIDDAVRLERIHAGAVLHPGTRLIGARTLIGPKAVIGSEGPATIVDTVVAASGEVASGYVAGSVLLAGARIGSNGHIRAGTLLEEEASVAHAVGLKQTILTAFVTLGSLINACDCLITGGRSRAEHTEIGSGFIHFNFTPWGVRGDKATASLVGDVTTGVFLREERIFLGGLSGLVGPSKIGHGTFTIAGQLIRADVAENTVYSETARSYSSPWRFGRLDRIEPRQGKNLHYIRQLHALRAWYRDVRLLRARLAGDAVEQLVLTAAIEVIDECIGERVTRLNDFLAARGGAKVRVEAVTAAACPFSSEQLGGSLAHIAWVNRLSEEEVAAGVRWLQSVDVSVERLAKA